MAENWSYKIKTNNGRTKTLSVNVYDESVTSFNEILGIFAGDSELLDDRSELENKYKTNNVSRLFFIHASSFIEYLKQHPELKNKNFKDAKTLSEIVKDFVDKRFKSQYRDYERDMLFFCTKVILKAQGLYK